MDFDVSFEFPMVNAIQVLDFDQMECDDYDGAAQISFIELQNVASGEIILESTADQCHEIEISDDIISLPSYGSFVNNLRSCENDCDYDYFENVTNSTTIEDINGNETSVNIMNNECSNDCTCTCQACLQIYFNAGTSGLHDVIYLDNICNTDLYYDFTNLWNQAEFTTYMEFPQDMCTSSSTSTTSENVRLLLRNKILAKSKNEANATAGATRVYNFSSTNS